MTQVTHGPPLPKVHRAPRRGGRGSAVYNIVSVNSVGIDEVLFRLLTEMGKKAFAKPAYADDSHGA